MSNLSQAVGEVTALFPAVYQDQRDIVVKGFKQAYKGVLDGKVRENSSFNTTHANSYIATCSMDIDKLEYFGFGLGFVVGVMENKPREFLADPPNNKNLVTAIQNVDIVSTYAQQAGHPQNKTLGRETGVALKEYIKRHARKWYQALQSGSSEFSIEERKSFAEIEARLLGTL